MDSLTTVAAASKQIIEGLGDEVVNNHPIVDNLGREQNAVFVFEEGVTFLLSRSRTKLGKQLNRWIHLEVLPSIRKTGSYSREKQSNEDLLRQAIEVIDLVFAKVPIKPELIAGLKLNAAASVNPALKPHIEPSRQLLIQSTATESKLLTPTEIGKQLEKSARWVNQKLIELGLQTKNESKKGRADLTYIPTDRGHEFCDICLATGSRDDRTTYQTLRWYESVTALLAS